MKLKEYLKESHEFSKLASDIGRNLSFAGIAVIWIFKNDKQNGHVIPSELLAPLFLLIISLAFDLLQYLIPSIIWSSFYRYHEKKGRNENYEVKASKWYNKPGWFLFYCKFALLIYAYFLLGSYILNKI